MTPIRTARAAVFLMLLLASMAAACADRPRDDATGPFTAPGPTTAPAPSASPPEDRQVAVYTAVLRNLVGLRATPGGAGGAKVLFVWDQLDRSIARGSGEHVVGTIEPEDQQAIVANLADQIRVEFVADTGSVWTEDGSRPRDGGAVVILGPIVGEDEHVRAGVGVICGNLCGEGTTLELDELEDGWTVTGTTGGSWIS